MASDTDLCSYWHTAGVKTIEDARNRETIAGASGRMSCKEQNLQQLPRDAADAREQWARIVADSERISASPRAPTALSAASRWRRPLFG